METYRIIPLRHAYRVEGQLNGQTTVVRTWPTEESAVSHLKALREVTGRFGRALQPGEKDWRGYVEAARHDQHRHRPPTETQPTEEAREVGTREDDRHCQASQESSEIIVRVADPRAGGAC